MLHISLCIQKHETMRNTNNDAICNLLGGNIKGGLFWCVHMHKCDNAPTVIIRIYKAYDFVDNYVVSIFDVVYLAHKSIFWWGTRYIIAFSKVTL